MTKIVICGANGKMGHTVASCIDGRDDCTVIGGVDSYTAKYADFPIVATPAELPEVPDVIIDFSNPSTLDELLEYALVNNVALVLATTGYDDAQIQKIQSASQQIPVFFTFNMSLGINLLVELAKKAATVLGGQFDIEIVEKHHNQKIDAPSGTAIMIANAINEHDVIFAGQDEVITLSHSAASKTVFAVGAVNAAVYLCGKPAGMYDMKQLVQE